MSKQSAEVAQSGCLPSRAWTGLDSNNSHGLWNFRHCGGMVSRPQPQISWAVPLPAPPCGQNFLSVLLGGSTPGWGLCVTPLPRLLQPCKRLQFQRGSPCLTCNRSTTEA